MIHFKIYLLLCLGIICHVVVSTAVTKSIDLKSWTERVVNASDSYTVYPMGTNTRNSKSPNLNERQYFLPLHLIKPALVKVYNYGPDGSKVDVYNHHKKIGEAGSFNLTRFNNNNIGRVYLPKGDHSLSLQPYYKDGKSEDLLSTHFVKVHILPKSSAYFLKKRDRVYNNPGEYTPEYNGYVQWDYDSTPKHYYNGGDDSVPNRYHNDDNYNVHKHRHNNDDDDSDCDDDDNDDEEKQNKPYYKKNKKGGYWRKWHKKGGWKIEKKKNMKIIYISTVHYSGPMTPPPVTLTSTLTVDHTSTIPEPPTPSPLERMVTETFQNPGTTETISKAGPTETTTVTTNGFDVVPAASTVILPIMMSIVTEYREISDIPTDNHSIEKSRLVTVTLEGGLTTILPSPITITNNPVTITLDGQVTTVLPGPVTLENEPVTVTNEDQTVTSLVDVDVTHYLIKQTVRQTIYETATQYVTVAFTSLNQVVETVYRGTSTKTENVIVTVFSTRPRTSTTTATPTPSLTPS